MKVVGLEEEVVTDVPDVLQLIQNGNVVRLVSWKLRETLLFFR